MRTRIGRALTIAGLGAAVGMFLSCRQIVGIKDNPPGPSTSACGLPWGTGDCASCVQTSCCVESNACDVSPACATYETCLSGCEPGDPRCRSQCTVDNRIGAGSSQEVSALAACLIDHCPSECSLSCGSMAAYLAPPAAAAGCQGCVAANACDDGRSCGASVDCEAYVRCLLACPTPDCIVACGTAHDAGAAIFGFGPTLGSQGASSALGGALSGVCATKCSYGGNWSCVGHVVWPSPHATTTTIVLEGVHEGPTGTRIEGATVSACRQSDPSCNAPLDQGTTDANGMVSLHVPTAQSNVNMPTGQLVFLMFTKAGYLTSYEYFNFPLSEETATLSPANSMYMLTAAEFTRDGGQDMALGSVFTGSVDCLGNLGPSGLNVSLGALDAGQLTNSFGFAIFSNVPVGITDITAVPVGLAMPSTRTTLYVHGGGPTALPMAPTP